MFHDKRPFRGKVSRHREEDGPRLYLEHYLIALVWLATIVMAIYAIMQ
jgi:hypothetical protein